MDRLVFDELQIKMTDVSVTFDHQRLIGPAVQACCITSSRLKVTLT